MRCAWVFWVCCIRIPWSGSGLDWYVFQHCPIAPTDEDENLAASLFQNEKRRWHQTQPPFLCTPALYPPRHPPIQGFQQPGVTMNNGTVTPKWQWTPTPQMYMWWDVVLNVVVHYLYGKHFWSCLLATCCTVLCIHVTALVMWFAFNILLSLPHMFATYDHKYLPAIYHE